MNQLKSKNLRTEEIILHMGPQHPSTHGVLHILLTLEGEEVIDAVPSIGYIHRGIEKLCEHRTYDQIIPLLDRTDYLSGTLNELPFVLATEKLMEVRVPKRSQYIRVIICELFRLASHLVWYATYALDIGAVGPLFYAFREREIILDFIEELTGSRMHPNYLRIGGVREDLPEGYEGRLLKFINSFVKRIDDYEYLLTNNIIFKYRTQDVGRLTKERAIDLGFTGPNLRANGVDLDLRRDYPYSGYDNFDFEVAIADAGDCYARYLVRMKEMRESSKIIRQALEDLPRGEIKAKVPKVIKPPAGEVYQKVESSRGIIGLYLISDGSNKPYRLRYRSPSFVHLLSLSEMMYGGKIGDAVAVIGSIDIVLGEVDR